MRQTPCTFDWHPEGASEGNFYFTVSTALSLISPAVVAVIVALPAARPVASPRSVTVAFEGALLSHATPGVPTTGTGRLESIVCRLPSSPFPLPPPAFHLTAG